MNEQPLPLYHRTMHDPTAIEPFCLECGYGITGLPEPRCPECGNAVDEGNIRQELRETTIGRNEAIYWLSAVPVLVGAFLIFAAWLLSWEVVGGLAMPWLVFAAWFFLWGGLIASIAIALYVAKRLAWNRAAKRKRSPYFRHNVAFINLSTIGLFLAQVLATAAIAFFGVMLLVGRPI